MIMTAQRESLPGYYRAGGESHDMVRTAVDFGGFAFSHVEGFVVLVSAVVCGILAGVLWFGG
jgi:hypothetical protein